MTQEKRWKIQELSTNGWTSIEPGTNNLTKEQCDIELGNYVENGTPPNRLRAVPSTYPDDGLETLERNA